MNTDLSDRFARNEDVVTREILGETLLVPIRADIADMRHIFALNETGAWIWQHLDGATPLAAVRDALSRAFEVEPDAAGHDVLELVDELDEAGLVRRVE